MPYTTLGMGLTGNRTQTSAPEVLRKDEAQEAMGRDILETGYGKGPSEW